MEADDYSILELFAVGGENIYAIPTYQREYKWRKQERNEFFDDILENDMGYFLGSIIGVSVKEGPLKQHWELVDGQQRIISLSLILAAIFSKLNELNKEHPLDKKQEIKLYNIKSELILDDDENKIRVIPSIQNHNREDYKAILARALSNDDDKPNVAGIRRIFQAYLHFQERINELLEKSDNKIEVIFDFLDRVNKSIVVMIDGGTRYGAYKLFRSLNDKGLELTPMDIIKSLFYASLFEKTVSNNSIPDFENDWDKLLEALGDEDTVQERFFRQYYNAFRKMTLNGTALIDITDYRMATRSNLTEIFEKIIRSNPEKSFKNLIAASRLYSFIIGRIENSDYTNLKKPLRDLQRIQGTPSYLLLLYLLEKKNPKLNKDHLEDLVKYLVRFFVRRNLTDHPATNSLTPLFMKIINEIDCMDGDATVELIKHKLVLVSSSDDDFSRTLNDPIYSENSAATRFILCALEEKLWKKHQSDLDKIEFPKFPLNMWEMKENNKQYHWTIEHIFPQSKNIPLCWENMIAGGDKATAKKIQEECVDCIGNLTISGINQELSNKCFEEKKEGYDNGLFLNEDVKNCDKWTREQIMQRTNRLANEALELFAFNEKKAAQ